MLTAFIAGIVVGVLRPSWGQITGAIGTVVSVTKGWFTKTT